MIGRNPLRYETQSPSEINPATWRAVRLNMIQNGVEYDLAFLRPLSWLKSTGAVVGGSIPMELHEMGLNGPAKVVGIDPCPVIEPDDGTGRNVVTGTMAHPGANIVYLDITGLDEPLGVTHTHPIWSETRQDFVVAGQMEVGEKFRTVTGQSATLTKIHPHRGPPEMVFNLEVDGQHVYHVAASGLLVHNACPWDEWKIGEHAIGPQPGHNWEKLLGGSEKTLENVKPYIEEVLEKGQWQKIADYHGRGGKITGEKLEATAIVNGHVTWVTAIKDLTGKIILNNAGVN